MEKESKIRQSRREVLRLVSGTATLSVGGTIGAAARGTQSLAATHSYSPSVSPPFGRQRESSARSPPWSQQAILAADDGDSGDQFGRSVAVSDDGTTTIVGALFNGNQNGDRTGSAYVFDESGGTWAQQAKLTPDDGDRFDRFGRSVAVSGDGTTAIVGAAFDATSNGRNAGSAYVFDRTDGEWSQLAKLAADDGNSDDRFGQSVAVSGDGTTAIVGARGGDPNGDFAGSAYVFRKFGGTWSQQAKLAAEDGDTDDRFGRSVAVTSDGTTVVVGALFDEDPNGPFAGSAYVFDESGGEWNQQAKLAAEDGDTNDLFGRSVAVSDNGTTAIIGASTDQDPNGGGSAYVFEKSGSAWSQQAKLAADDGDSMDGFGSSIAVSSDGTTAIVGASTDEEPNSGGSAYVFENSGGDWNQQTRLADDDGDRDDNFGLSVAVSGDGTTAIIGARRHDDSNSDRAGSAYVFETEQQTTETTERTTTAESGDGTGGSTPGFGVGTLLAGLTGAGYLRWRDTEDDTDQ